MISAEVVVGWWGCVDDLCKSLYNLVLIIMEIILSLLSAHILNFFISLTEYVKVIKFRMIN